MKPTREPDPARPAPSRPGRFGAGRFGSGRFGAVRSGSGRLRRAGSGLGPYAAVLSQPALRRILPGMLVSALGDGMSMVAVAWLAVQIAPPSDQGLWTGLAVAAYSLPATLGAAAFGRLVRGWRGPRLVGADASLRAVALGAVAVLAVTGVLGPVGYVILLAASSLLHAWGNSGAYTLVAELLPDGDARVAGNALVSTFAQASLVVGPAVAGAVTALAGPGWVIAIDAVSWGVLAACCWRAAARPADPPAAGAPPEDEAPPAAGIAPSTEVAPAAGVARAAEVPRAAEVAPGAEVPPDPAGGPAGGAVGGWRVILGQPRLVGLIAVTCVFFFLYGPVEVALPIHVARELHGSAGLLGAFWAVFSVGAVLGGLGAGLLRNSPLWMVVVGIIVGWGAALLPLGLTDAVLPGLLGFGAGGLIYGPFTAICTALFQRASPPALLSRVLATRTALTSPSGALGTLLGGPVVGAIGGRYTLLASAAATVALGVVVAAAVSLNPARSLDPARAPRPGRSLDPARAPRPGRSLDPARALNPARSPGRVGSGGGGGGRHDPADQLR